MKIALVNIYNRQDEYKSKYSLATMRLAEYVMSFGYEVDLVPIDLNDYKNFNFSVFKKYNIVGLSNYSWVNTAINYISNTIKEINHNVEIIIGGPQVENIDLSKWCDAYFIIGEGEVALLNLIKYIESGKREKNFFEDNPNVFNKDNPKHQKVESEIALANPLFTNVIPEDREFLWYETCRGCAYSCGYCGHKTRKKVGYMDLDIIEKEIKSIGKLEFKKVFVIDPNFAGNKERAKKIIDMFNKYSPQTQLILYLRPEFIDDEAIELYSKANIDEIRIGIQTINKNVPLWVRSNSLKHVEKELPKLSKNSIKWRAELIVGLPGDDLEGLVNSIDFIESLSPTSYYCYHLTLIKGLKMYSLVNSFENKYWITEDEFGRAFSSSTYDHSELLEMLEYSKNRSEQYNNREKKLIIKKY